MTTQINNPLPQPFVESKLVFNEKDKEIIEYAVNKRRNILLTSSAGCGKTTLINEIIRRLDIEERIYSVTASTGVAACAIKGTTLHRWAGIGLGKDDKLKLYKRVNSKIGVKTKIRATQTLIIDEVSMIGAELFDKIDFVLRKIRKDERVFANIQLILVGDMLQLAPINDAWIFESECWNNLDLKIFNLTESKRYKDLSYFQLLSRFRIGEQTEEDYQKLEECVVKYRNNKDAMKNWEIIPTILYSKKIDVSGIL